MDIHAYIQSGIIESYLLGIAGEEEEKELNSIRRQYPEVEAAIQRAEEWLHGVASSYTAPVPSKVKDRIFAVINEDLPSRPVAVIRPFYRYFAAASLILLICSLAANLILYKKYLTEKNNALALQQNNQTLLANNNLIQAKMNIVSNDLKLMAAAGSSKIILNAVAGKNQLQTVLLLDAAKQQLLMVGNSLPNAPTGKQYQLWAIVRGKPVNAGMLTGCDPYCRFNAVAGAEAYAVTLEKAGGSDQPTLEQMYVFGKVNS
ncbi:hypothetical protein HHL16_13295 [Pseudoflavitalea sp. G-6-1-2]|uniref:anti-sigma factor n=1 Tax=Pseudoflavitalea sp. G-6-1-2 TaxID=2728841 RepID=UPI00146C49C1|nr:anti-sigma factor [Pseudoflavitalea sp. G-6-1-2]NML21860.1 hypothetical protein [Pseudoflavitalea sp. G-6-1-2]